MRLSRLILVNFQKHANLTLDFVPGVNYLVGRSGAGKSCIRRAISFLCFNSPRTDAIRMEGTKTTSVVGVFDNCVELERVKSASINRYIVRKDGKEQVYDSIGASIPDDVKAVIKMATIDFEKESLNLNISEQIVLPFLSDKSASFRMKLFNKLTGSDLIDTLIQSFNKSILGIGREIKTNETIISTNAEQLDTVTKQITDKQALYGKLSAIKLELDKVFEKYNVLVSLAEQLKLTQVAIDTTTKELGDIKTVSQDKLDALRTAINEWVELNDLYLAYKSAVEEFVLAQEELKAIIVPDIDVSSVKVEIDKLNALKTAKLSVQKAQELIKTALTSIDVANKEIVDLTAKYAEMLKKAGVCPICKQKTDKCEVCL